MQKTTPLSCEERRYSRFTFVENTISNLPKLLRAKFLGSDGPCSFINICKFGSFKNPFAMITYLSDFFFRFRRLILLAQTTKVISKNYSSSTSSWSEAGDEWSLSWYLWLRIYTSIPIWTHSPKFTSRNRSTKLKHIFHGTSLKWSRIPSRISQWRESLTHCWQHINYSSFP